MELVELDKLAKPDGEDQLVEVPFKIGATSPKALVTTTLGVLNAEPTLPVEAVPQLRPPGVLTAFSPEARVAATPLGPNRLVGTPAVLKIDAAVGALAHATDGVVTPC